ncbi:MAG: hypothetical protein KDA05_05530 [Phycisphaerales bacterium]|nr:hypothetical protein [Phycisphaerales bacterium]
MTDPRINIVLLRQPDRAKKTEMRSDPFYEFGSFGCTQCHRKNLMHRAKAHELRGARFAFAQGGPLGFRLVHLTPPVSVVRHPDRIEVIWEPAEQPFRYDRAPVLAGPKGETDFPALLVKLQDVDRPTWPARFSSAFRSRRTPLAPVVALQIASVFERLRQAAPPDALAASYIDALPYAPNRPDPDRAGTLAHLRAGGSLEPDEGEDGSDPGPAGPKGCQGTPRRSRGPRASSCGTGATNPALRPKRGC